MHSKKNFWKILSNPLFFHESTTAPHEDGDLHLDMVKKERVNQEEHYDHEEWGDELSSDEKA